MAMSLEQRQEAYRRITRDLRTMHHTERTALDTSPNYYAILQAVDEGRNADAIELSADLMTTAGDLWRAKQDIFHRINQE